MPNKTIATLFSCGGGFDAGAKAAGYTPVFAIDNDPKPLASYTANFGDHAVCADIRGYDFTSIKANHLHASPVCKGFSNANPSKGETQFDIDCAKAVCRGIEQINPDTFSLENVVAYANAESKSFELIVECLYVNGYHFNYRTLNAADYGVPQTRKRLILLASKEKYPLMPLATHSKPTQQKSLFELPDWVTWYEAIADLIPTLKETELAPWQQRAFEKEKLIKHGLIGEDKVNGFSRLDPVLSDCPSFTLKSSHFPRIALIEKVGARSDRAMRTISDKFPVPTLKAIEGRTWEQWVIQNGVKFYQLNVKCLARLQSFPDWYIFPQSRPVACSLIGNSVPPLLAQRIMETFN